MKKLLSFIIIGGLLTCTAVSCGGSEKTGYAAIAEKATPAEQAEEAVRQYTVTTYNGDFDTNIELTYPKDMIPPMKEAGTFDALQETLTNIKETTKLKKMSISDETELSEQALRGAGLYFNSVCSLLDLEKVDYNITAGYTMKTQKKIKYNGKTSNKEAQLSAVLIEGDGWKVITMDEAELADTAEKYGKKN